MSIFKKKNLYRTIRWSPKKFKHVIVSEGKPFKMICSSCGKTIVDKMYYCPVCKKYYDFSCVIQTATGAVCPDCDGLIFLKTVEIVRRL